MTKPSAEAWNSGQAYEQYVGRWSRQVATLFLRWLDLPPGLAWADVGCGTGALTSTILSSYSPVSVRGIDYSPGFLSQAVEHIPDPHTHFLIGDATRLPWAGASVDAAVSGLVLNFVRHPDAMIREMVRVTRPGGWVAVYVWDYAGGMQMMRTFWDTAISISPQAATLDQAERFPLCQPEPLQALFERTQLKEVSVRPLQIPTVFKSFDDYWQPFLGKTGPAPSYLAGLSEELREMIRTSLEARLAPIPGQPIELTARAWGVRGRV